MDEVNLHMAVVASGAYDACCCERVEGHTQ